MAKYHPQESEVQRASLLAQAVVCAENVHQSLFSQGCLRPAGCSPTELLHKPTLPPDPAVCNNPSSVFSCVQYPLLRVQFYKINTLSFQDAVASPQRGQSTQPQLSVFLFVFSLFPCCPNLVHTWSRARKQQFTSYPVASAKT